MTEYTVLQILSLDGEWHEVGRHKNNAYCQTPEDHAITSTIQRAYLNLLETKHTVRLVADVSAR